LPREPTRAVRGAPARSGRPVDDKLKRKVTNARFVDLPSAGPYLFLTKEADVLREIHSFVAALPTITKK